MDFINYIFSFFSTSNNNEDSKCKTRSSRDNKKEEEKLDLITIKKDLQLNVAKNC